MNRVIATAALLALMGAGTAAQAAEENDSGFYIGAGVGQFNVQIDDVDDTDEAVQKLDDDDNSWKFFGGYRFNPYLSLELAYIDFGGPEDSFEGSGSDGEYKLDISGFAPYIIGSYPIGPVELFAKAGYYFYDVDVTADFDDPDVDSSSSEEDFLYGFGVGATFFEHLNARLEYEKIDSDLVDDADALWLSASWRF